MHSIYALLGLCIIFGSTHGFRLPFTSIQIQKRLLIHMTASVPVPKRSNTFIFSPQSGDDSAAIIQTMSLIQQGDMRKIGVFGTNQNVSPKHLQMIELLAYALVLSGNHIFTSGGGFGTNRAVITGALRACRPELLTVILPQSLNMQPSEMHPLLMRVVNLEEQPENDKLDLKESANKCNELIMARVDEVLIFAFHASETILTSVDAVRDDKVVTVFYLD